MRIDILGTKYKVMTRKISEDETLKNNRWAGYCGEESKEIVIADMSELEYFSDMTDLEKENYRKKTLRHEIIHAFLNESGLSDNASVPNSGWAKHEEMIDWFAIQSPKIYKVFKKAGCLQNN